MFVGIDISKFKHDIAVIDEQKQSITPGFVIAENAQGYHELFERLGTVSTRLQAAEVYIGMEATGSYWMNVYHFLHQKTSWHVTVINPVQTRRFAQSRLRRAVTDPIDALEIAHYMRERKPAPTIAAPMGLQIVQDIDKQIVALIKERNANIYRLRLELGKTFPELEKQTPSLVAQRVLVLLSHYPTAEMVRNATIEQLGQLTCGSRKCHLSMVFIKQVKQLAEDSIACKTGSDAGIVVQTLAARITEIQAHICRLKKQIVQVYRHYSKQPSILATIPGIAPLTASILEAYIGDVHRFSEYKKIVAYFGLNPTVCMSGVSKKGRGYLQKKGNPRVRNILFMNVLSMIRFKVDPIYSFYKSKLDEGRPKLVAIGAAMRKLLVIVYTMLKNNEPFQPKK
jgi:transposase